MTQDMASPTPEGSPPGAKRAVQVLLRGVGPLTPGPVAPVTAMLAARLTAFALAAFTRAAGTDLVGDIGAGGLIDHPHRQLHLAAIVEAEDLHLDRVADIDEVRGAVDPLIRQ